MEFKRLDLRIMKSWRIGRIIRLAIFTAIAAGGTGLLTLVEMEGIWLTIVTIALWALPAYAFIGFLLYPPIEYRQWGYYIDEEKVVIKHGLFFIKQTIIPIIRIQNITMSQGPINRKLGLYSVEMALASGSFDIPGLDKETAEHLSESLKSKLYLRIEQKGVL